jgi:hypothetical protein
MRPKAVVISASAMPAEIPARRALRGHAGEGVDDTHRGAEEADERRGGPHRGQNADAALEVSQADQHLPFDGALGRVDVGSGNRRAVAEQGLHFGERLAHHVGDVTLLALLGQRDSGLQVLLLDGPRELRGELPGLPLGALKLDVLLDHDGQRPRGHDEQDDYHASGEIPHLTPKLKNVYAHV